MVPAGRSVRGRDTGTTGEQSSEESGTECSMPVDTPVDLPPNTQSRSAKEKKTANPRKKKTGVYGQKISQISLAQIRNKVIKTSNSSKENDDDLVTYFNKDCSTSAELEDYNLQGSSSSDSGTEPEVDREEPERDAKLTIGSWVIVSFQDPSDTRKNKSQKLYIGRVSEVQHGKVTAEFVRKTTLPYFAFLAEEDKATFRKSGIIKFLQPPELTHRGALKFQDIGSFPINYISA